MIRLLDETVCKPSVFEDRNRAAKHLGGRLARGQLGLVLGAGISVNASIPSWPDLVLRCCERKSVPFDPIGVTDEDLQLAMASVRRQCATDGGGDIEYQSLVREVLYSTLDDGWLKDANPLLQAIGGLLVGLKGGRVSELFNYNFDSILEEYLSNHGFTAQSIAALPCLVSDSDVTIYHPHGYLPRLGSAETDTPVFDERSYTMRIGEINNEDALWSHLASVWMLRKQLLFVGLSGMDRIFLPLLARAQKALAANSERRLTGVWLFGPGSDKKYIERVQSYDCAAVVFDSFDDYPEFLRHIRREAAAAL